MRRVVHKWNHTRARSCVCFKKVCGEMLSKKFFMLTSCLTITIIVFLVNGSISTFCFLIYNDPIKIMPLGDSITVGVGTTDFSGYRKPLYFKLIKSGYYVDFVGTQHGGNTFYDNDHQGRGGYKTSDINRRNRGFRAIRNPFRLSEYLEYSHPDIILYHVGTNDLRSDNSIPENVADAVNITLAIIYDFEPNITVILAKIILTQYRNCNIRIRKYNSLLESKARYWANKGYSIILVDMENILEYSDYFDRLHPNEQGYEKMSEVWYNSIVFLLSIENFSLGQNNIYNKINLDDYVVESSEVKKMQLKNLIDLQNKIKSLNIKLTNNEGYSCIFKYDVGDEEILDDTATLKLNVEFGEEENRSIYNLWISKSTGKTIQAELDNLILFGDFAQLLGNTTSSFWRTMIYSHWMAWDFNVIHDILPDHGVLSYIGTEHHAFGPTNLFIYKYKFEGYDAAPKMYRFTVESWFAPTQFGGIMAYLFLEPLGTKDWIKLELVSIELAELEPPKITEGIINASTMNIKPGEEFSLSYNLKNEGNSSVILYVPLIIDDELEDIQIVQLETDESETVNFIVSLNIEGDHLVEIRGRKVKIIVKTPSQAAFTLKNLIINPGHVNVGETVNISVNINNTGGKSGSYTIPLKIDGEINSLARIVLNSNETKIVSFDVQTTKIGTFSVDINGLQGNFTVTKPPEFPFVPSPSHSQELPYELILFIVVLTVLLFWISKSRH